MPVFTKKQVAAYLKKPNRCPVCQSDDIQATGVTGFDGGEYHNEIECLGCEAVWVDVLTLSSIEAVELPKSKKAKGSKV